MIAVIDYGVGNLFSVEKALAHVGAEAEVTHEAEKIAQAEKLVLPGVGAFGDCMKRLEATGLIPVILREIRAGKPLLGICVGLQILFEGSDESPDVAGLSVFSGRVRRIEAPQLKIPHMGWNSLEFNEASGKSEKSALFRDIQEGAYVYFVHSYHAMPEDAQIITAHATYGERITAAVAQANVQAVQFHPEKSGAVGSAILKNFVNA